MAGPPWSIWFDHFGLPLNPTKMSTSPTNDAGPSRGRVSTESNMGPPVHINGTGLWAVHTVGAKISGDQGKDEINYLLNSVSRNMYHTRPDLLSANTKAPSCSLQRDATRTVPSNWRASPRWIPMARTHRLAKPRPDGRRDIVPFSPVAGCSAVSYLPFNWLLGRSRRSGNLYRNSNSTFITQAEPVFSRSTMSATNDKV